MIRFSPCQSLKLLFLRAFEVCLCYSCTESKLWKVFKKGEAKLAKSLDLVKLMKRMNELRVLKKKFIENGVID